MCDCDHPDPYPYAYPYRHDTRGNTMDKKNPLKPCFPAKWHTMMRGGQGEAASDPP